MKWSVDFSSISRNGHGNSPFHKMDSWVVHFTKWTILHLGHNIYIKLKPCIFSCGCQWTRSSHFADLVLSPLWLLLVSNLVLDYMWEH